MVTGFSFNFFNRPFLRKNPLNRAGWFADFTGPRTVTKTRILIFGSVPSTELNVPFS
jgi:hypothetical protein